MANALDRQPTVQITNGHVVTTSLDIAKCFNKQHQHVLRKIDSLDCSADFSQSNFGLTSYQDEQNKKCRSYNITRDGFTYIAMSFTGQRAAAFKEAYITAFNQMEAQLRAQAMLQKTRMVMEITNGQVSTAEIMDKTDFITSRAKLAYQITTDCLFSNNDLIDIIQAASNRLALNHQMNLGNKKQAA